jgi:hypothetical protein
MPQIKFMVWNVQNFGAATATAAIRGSMNLRLQTIARLAMEKEVNVLALMEVLPSSTPELRKLLESLRNASGQPWYCDWIASCIGAGVAPGTEPTSPENLTFSSRSRNEGYAVFWRLPVVVRQAPVALSMGVSGPAPLPITNALTLSTQGRPVAATPKPFRALGPFDPGNPGASPAPGAAPFVDALYPSTAVFAKNYWQNSRRPAVLQVQMGTETANLLVYHAPSVLDAADDGILASSLARELYANLDPTNNLEYAPNVVIGGDFNIDAIQYPGDYQCFLDTFANNGSGCSPGNASAAPTMMKLDLFPSPNINDYYGTSIDHVFYRLPPSAGAAVSVVDLLAMFTTATSLTMIQDWFEYMVDAGPDAFPAVYFATPQDWEDFLADLQRGYFRAPGPAALFIKLCLSDHLPLITTFSY